MAANGINSTTVEGGKSISSQYNYITGTQICSEYQQLHAREKLMYEELEVFKCDMAELNQILTTALRQNVREVISNEINILSYKIASLKQLLEGKMESERNWTEVVTGQKKSIKTRKRIAQPIPVIKNRYDLLYRRNEGETLESNLVGDKEKEVKCKKKDILEKKKQSYNYW
jgi:hypothetical protein